MIFRDSNYSTIDSRLSHGSEKVKNVLHRLEEFNVSKSPASGVDMI
jgi:hypothetical protein